MRVSLIHEWLTNLAGSEKVVLALLDAFPQARLYTSMFEPEAFAELDPARVETSFLDRIGHSPTAQTRLAPLLPLAMRSLTVAPSDLVITSFHNFALATRAPAGSCHVVYCHTPTRFVHARSSMSEERRLGAPGRVAARLYGRVDRRLGGRGDVWVANSHHIAQRIEGAYGHDARVIHPPVDVERFAAAPRSEGEHYVMVGRLVPYKRAELAIRAFEGREATLHVVGDGRDRERLEELAPPNVRFLGRVDDAQLPGIMAGARALLFPGEEDFGITPVEAMAAGTPVIAYGSGGILDTVTHGRSGVFFSSPDVDAVREAIDTFEARTWDHAAIAADTARFSRQRFIDAFRELAAELT
ncbi:MAG TPA: glycosyltransferase [Acidimicrobiales bacterium]|nr:glycosyltransferase [Acidimicrobiales bacterium]